MNFLDTLSNEKVYLNIQQNQIYTASRINTLFKKWTEDFESQSISYDIFKRLFVSHFAKLKELPKFEIINNKKYSTQCSYATERHCSCWCKGLYHGRMLLVQEAFK